MKTRRLLACLAAVLTAITAAACGTSESDAIRADGSVDLSKVTLHVGDQKGEAVQALLAASGELASAPYRISWAQFTSGPPMLESVNAGAVDVGAVGDAPPVFAAAADSAVKIVSAFNSGLSGQALVVPKDSSLTSPEQLRGKTIAVAKGSSAHYHLLALLTKIGLKYSDIRPEYLQPGDALAALSSGRVDAWDIWDPYTAEAQYQVGARILADGNGLMRGDSFFVASTKSLSDKAKVAALHDFLGRVRRARQWANTHPEDWARAYAKLTDLPYEVTLAAAKRGPYQDFPIDRSVIDGEQQVADAFSDADLIPGKVTIADHIDARFDAAPRPS